MKKFDFFLTKSKLHKQKKLVTSCNVIADWTEAHIFDITSSFKIRFTKLSNKIFSQSVFNSFSIIRKTVEANPHIHRVFGRSLGGSVFVGTSISFAKLAIYITYGAPTY